MVEKEIIRLKVDYLCCVSVYFCQVDISLIALIIK